MEQYGVQDQWMSGFVRWSDIRKGRCSLVVVLICAQGLHCAHTRLCIREWGRGWGVANRKEKKIEGMAQGWSKNCVEQRWKHHGFIIVYSKIQLSAFFFFFFSWSVSATQCLMCVSPGVWIVFLDLMTVSVCQGLLISAVPVLVQFFFSFHQNHCQDHCLQVGINVWVCEWFFSPICVR